MPLNNRRILEIAQEQSAMDCSCLASDFERPENTVRESKPAEGARRYLKLPHLCDLVSYGTNVVACCAPELIPGVEDFLRAMPNVPSCFETPGIYALNALLAPYDARVCFMAEYFLPELSELKERDCGLALRLLAKVFLALRHHRLDVRRQRCLHVHGPTPFIHVESPVYHIKIAPRWQAEILARAGRACPFGQ